MKINIIKCPYCNGTEFVKATQGGHASIHGERFLSMSPVHHVICTTCGSIVRSYVTKPKKFLKWKDRK